MKCIGRASHTAAARVTGINAIAKAAKAVLALEQELVQYHPAVGNPVISIKHHHGRGSTQRRARGMHVHDRSPLDSGRNP